MGIHRSVASSAARARFGDLLQSLADGPVEITRNGRKVAMLLASTDHESATLAARLEVLAPIYAAGNLSWREIAAEPGAAFGDLLLELSRQGLSLPRVTRPEQIALLVDILRPAVDRARALRDAES